MIAVLGLSTKHRFHSSGLRVRSTGTILCTTSVQRYDTDNLTRSLRLSLVLAAFAVLLRPTNAIIWLALGTVILTRATLDGKSPLTKSVFLILVREVLLCGWVVNHAHLSISC
jgi:hypothetical protein